MGENAFLDYIIVGQGLAGSAVALQLLKLKKKILVIDEQGANAASRVAAGMFNPIIGKNDMKTWMADEIFPYLHQFYKEAEVLTRQKFLHSMPVYKPFTSAAEQNDWMGKSSDQAYSKFIDTVFSTSHFANMVNDPFGGLQLKQTGYLNTRVYLAAVSEYLQNRQSFLKQHFAIENLKIAEDHVSYAGWRASKIIFCQGTEGLNNKWFQALPINPLKGETLTIKTSWTKDVILNRGVYMVLGDEPGKFKVGATYSKVDNFPGTTQVARQELQQKLQELLMIPFEIQDQSWGFRPTTPDRRPLLGSHPQFEQLIIFNGLGTKGVSLAPYFSEVLVRWLENKEPLDKRVSVTRYN